MMSFQLVDNEWAQVLQDAVAAGAPDATIISPFIKVGSARRLLKGPSLTSLRVITRFDLAGFYAGVSDTSALRLLLESGAQIRGVRNLHAKLYLFGSRAIVTSANLTEAALLRNHEFGFVSDEEGIAGKCRTYFDKLWARAGSDLTAAQLTTWESVIRDCLLAGGQTQVFPGLVDHGADAGFADLQPAREGWSAGPRSAFVKFLGEAHRREPRDFPVMDEVVRAGCHRACAYPAGRRPRQVGDGDIMYLGRLVHHPQDIRVFGRAVAMRYVQGRDDASEEDKALRPFMAKWCHLIRLHHATFVAGTLANGVSLYGLMHELQSSAFKSTQQHASAGRGNTDPRRAYSQQPQVALTTEAQDWLDRRLEQAFEKHGVIPAAQLSSLDWPKSPP